MFTDTHVHLNHDTFTETLDDTIERARSERVMRMIVVGFSPEMNERAASIASREGVHASAGIHPTIAHEVDETAFTYLEAFLPEAVAIGECGLDFYHDKTHMEEQIDVFERQVRLAKTYDLPLIIHMRDAAEKTFETLEKHAPLRGVMHCYSGSPEMAERFLSLGLHISLGGPVTFKNAKTPKEVAAMLPIDRLLIETDAPFLAPHPYRGKRNEPSYLPLVAEGVAEARGDSLGLIEEKTTENAARLFALKG